MKRILRIIAAALLALGLVTAAFDAPAALAEGPICHQDPPVHCG
jgi:hypothetical protein